MYAAKKSKHSETPILAICRGKFRGRGLNSIVDLLKQDPEAIGCLAFKVSKF